MAGRDHAVEVWVEQADCRSGRMTRPPLQVRRERPFGQVRHRCRSSAASCRRGRPSWPFHPDPTVASLPWTAPRCLSPPLQVGPPMMAIGCRREPSQLGPGRGAPRPGRSLSTECGRSRPFFIARLKRLAGLVGQASSLSACGRAARGTICPAWGWKPRNRQARGTVLLFRKAHRSRGYPSVGLRSGTPVERVRGGALDGSARVTRRRPPSARGAPRSA